MKYRHFKGGIYTFICNVILEDNGYKIVVYKDANGNVYYRSAHNFHMLLENGMKRFERI